MARCPADHPYICTYLCTYVLIQAWTPLILSDLPDSAKPHLRSGQTPLPIRLDWTKTMSSHSEPGPEPGSESSRVPTPSSTIYYQQESFDGILPKVIDLARSTIWPGSDPDDQVTVERLKGGSFNRVIGLTLTRSETTNQDATSSQHIEPLSSERSVKRILRIPRFDSGQIAANAAAFLFARRYLGTQVPRVTIIDKTDDNILKKPYMVQNRLNGRPVSQAYPELGHDQKCRVARDLGRAVRNMLAVRSTQIGSLVLLQDDKTRDAEFGVIPWRPEIFWSEAETDEPIAYSEGAGTESTAELLRTRFRQELARDLRSFGEGVDSPYSEALYGAFCSMASELDADGWFKHCDGYITLAHLDLEPRNIMVDPTCGPDRPIISGILDWDSAVLAPMFMSCTPPMWIWGWLEGEDEDERKAGEEPVDPEQKELKLIFEEAAGPFYLRFAYEPAYRLARRLVRLAVGGIHSNEDDREARAMLTEWRSIHGGNTTFMWEPWESPPLDPLEIEDWHLDTLFINDAEEACA